MFYADREENVPDTKWEILYKLGWMGSEKMEQCLNCLEEGQRGEITRIALDGQLYRRLSDLGLTAGTPVLCLRKSPAGDPVLYRIRGTMLALRKKDSSRVFVEVTS